MRNLFGPCFARADATADTTADNKHTASATKVSSFPPVISSGTYISVGIVPSKAPMSQRRVNFVSLPLQQHSSTIRK
jgi:hypothetical protein